MYLENLESAYVHCLKVAMNERSTYIAFGILYSNVDPSVSTASDQPLGDHPQVEPTEPLIAIGMKMKTKESVGASGYKVWGN